MDKQTVLDTIKKYPESKKALEELFPDFFKEYLDLGALRKDPGESNKLFTEEQCRKAGFNGNFFQIRGVSEYKGKAFYLANELNWELKRDSAGQLVLIPTKKNN